MKFNIEDHPIIFENPLSIKTPLAWVSHIPFAFLITKLLKPEILVELGTHSGNSFNAFCQAVQQNNLTTECYAVDTWKGDSHSGFYSEEVYDSLSKHINDNYSKFAQLMRMTFDEANEYFNDKTIDLLHIDGLHTYEAVKHDFGKWLPKLNGRSVVLFHDTVVRERGFGVWKFWEEISKKYSSYNFLHGNGLGVLLVGDKIEGEIKDLIFALNENQFTTNILSSLGNFIKQKEIKKSREGIINNNHFGQLFYADNNEPYREGHSIKKRINSKNTEFIFDLSSIPNIKRLRFDPINDKVSLRLIYAYITTTDNERIDLSYKETNAVDVDNNNLYFRHNDPQFHYELEDANIFSINSFIVKIEFIKTGEAVLEELLTRYYETKNNNEKELFTHIVQKNNLSKRIKELEEQFEILQREKNLLEVDLNKNNETILNHKIKYKLFVDQIKQLRDENHSFNDQIFRLKIQSKDLNDKLSEKAKEINELLKLIDNSKRNELELVEKVNSLNEIIASTKKENEYTEIKDRKEKEDLSLKIDQLKNENGLLINNQKENTLKLIGYEKQIIENKNKLKTSIKEKEEIRRESIKRMHSIYKVKNDYIFRLYTEIKSSRNSILLPFKTILNYIINVKLLKDFKLLANCELFDEEFYLKTNPDVKKVNPIKHYLLHGACEGRNPSEEFDTNFYLENNFDVFESGMNPLVHYLLYGAEEKRKTKPTYSKEKKKSLIVNQKLLEVKAQEQLDFIRTSKAFNETFYLNQNPDVKKSGIDPLWHYFSSGCYENRNPSPEFDTKYYLSRNNDVRESKINPFYHYLMFGKSEGRVAKAIKRYYSNKQIIFISHDASRTGAPILLSNIVDWFYKYTSYEIKTILLRGGDLYSSFASLGDVYVLNENADKKIIKAELYSFIGKKKKSYLFLNTVAASKISNFIELKKFSNCLYSHEMEKILIQFSDELDLMKKNINNIICASETIKDNLILNHGYQPDNITVINASIEPLNNHLSIHEKENNRQKLGLPAKGKYIVGCGTVFWIKNPMAFIEVAKILLNKVDEDVYFLWIGGGEDLNKCREIINKYNLNKNVFFIGPKNNARDYLSICDIFLLPSIEDSFPLVCLEAADCCLPIICYEKAGGMPGFVEYDAGIVVEYNNVNRMVDATYELITNNELRHKLGKGANKKLLANFTVDIASYKIFKRIEEELLATPFISVIVPNYNHKRYLEQRLKSIYNQTYKDFEVILLDDFSDDSSIELLNKYAKKYKYCTKTFFNDRNSGNVFKQWKKGIEAARGEYLWIAESDDYSDENFLYEVVKGIINDDVILSYANSRIVDGNGDLQFTYDEIPWLYDVDPFKWKKNYYIKGKDEFQSALAIKCTIPNVSATIFKKKFALKALRNVEGFKKAGDWIFYASLSRYGSFSYCKEALNYHRRHENTITEKEGYERGVMEIFWAHRFFVDNFNVNENTRLKMVSFIENEYNIYKERGQIKDSLLSLYQKDVIFNTSNRPKLLLIQKGLNLGKGGAEKILIDSANLFYERGYDVSIINITDVNHELPYQLNINIDIYSISDEKLIEKYLEKTKANIGIVFGIGHSDLYILRSLKKQNIKTIYSLHNHPPFFSDTPGEDIILNTMNLADYNVVLINSFKEIFKKKGITKPIRVIPNFVIKPVLKNEITNNEKYLFSAGRLVDQKQHSILIDSFSLVAQKYPYLKLLIAGEGQLRSKLEKQIAELGLEKRIILLGEVDNIGDYYMNCVMFIFPSKFEGFGLTIFEAAAFGKPIILFKHCPPYNEIIDKNSGIILVDKMNSHSLARAIENEMDNNRHPKIKKENIIQLYNKYSPELIISRWFQLFEELSSNN